MYSPAGTIVLYNPDILVVSNIKTYINCLAHLYVIDNSENVDKQIIEAINAIGNNISYHPLGKNEGIAKALNEGCGLAYNEGHKWILTMDQDSYFPEKTFFDIWKNDLAKDDNIGIVTPSYTLKYDRWIKKYSDNFNEIHFVITSGNIINLKIWHEIGGFENKLFIDEVDHDYCLKLRAHGYKILMSKEVLMGHSVGETYRAGLVKRKFNLHTPVRYYYMSRNGLYIIKKYFFIDNKFVRRRGYYLIKMVVKIILLYPNKFIYLKFLFSGVRDFALSKYNKYDS